MNTNPANKPLPLSNLGRDDLQWDDLQWDIERYLLNDPALDRDLFEQRMLNDTSLAEQVAASVGNLNLVAEAASAASASCTPYQTAPTPISQVVHNTTSIWTTSIWIPRFVAIASAAMLLIAISAWQLRSATHDDQLARIADNWTAFESLTTDEAIELTSASQSHLVDALPIEDEFRSDDLTESTSNDQRDWLVEAAREFYLASSEGAAG